MSLELHFKFWRCSEDSTRVKNCKPSPSGYANAMDATIGLTGLVAAQGKESEVARTLTSQGDVPFVAELVNLPDHSLYSSLANAALCAAQSSPLHNWFWTTEEASWSCRHG